MSSAIDPDQSDFGGADLLQSFTINNGYQPVFCTMNDVTMAIDVTDPFIRLQAIT